MVLTDICHDLGITCEHTLWRDLHVAILTDGGSMTETFNDIVLRVRARYVAPHVGLSTPLLCPLPVAATVARYGTGPP